MKIHKSPVLLDCDNCSTEQVVWFSYVFLESGEAEKFCVSCSDEWYEK